MENSLRLKFLGIGSNAIEARTGTDEGVIHGILLQNKENELAVFISVIGLKQNENKDCKDDGIAGVIGGFTLEDLKQQLDELKKDNWTPLGLIQIDLGEKAVNNFLKDENEPFALINLINQSKNNHLNDQRNRLEKKYTSYIL